jgi:RNA polymerase sigma factor (sigma-70 family)
MTINWSSDLFAVAQRTLDARDWHLLDNSVGGANWQDFVHHMIVTMDDWRARERYPGASDHLIERAVVHEYSKLLYDVVGHRDTDIGARALIEIWNYVTPMIRKILRDDDRAQDVAMDVLIMVCEKRDQVRDPGSFLSWAGVIAHREAVRAAKAHGREVVMTDLGGDDDLAAEELEALLAASSSDPSGSDPGERVRAAELEARIRECLHGMRRAAEVFIGLVLHDLSVAEIAQRLGMKPNAIYAVFHRARKRLQGCRRLLADLDVALGATP